jgi:hypothetical protein
MEMEEDGDGVGMTTTTTSDTESQNNGSTSKSSKFSPAKSPSTDFCSVCYGDLQEEGRGITDVCDHLFCFSCIFEWSLKTNTCPMCKRRFHQITKVRSNSFLLDR